MITSDYQTTRLSDYIPIAKKLSPYERHTYRLVVVGAGVVGHRLCRHLSDEGLRSGVEKGVNTSAVHIGSYEYYVGETVYEG